MSQSKNHKTPIVVAISGGGRSLKNLIEKQTSYQVVGVISSTKNCGGMKIARDAKLPIFVGDFKAGGKDLIDELNRFLKERHTEWVILGGFLKKFPILDGFENHIVNIHPALLPKYGGQGMYGNRVHEAVLYNKEKESGATVHFLSDEYDKGQIIAQTKVPVKLDDTKELLAARVFAAECQLLPEVIEKLIAGNLPVQEGFEVLNYEL